MIFRSIIIFFLLLTPLFSQKYELGEGYNIPTTPIYIGGYATLDYIKRHDNYNRFRVDELALLSYASLNKFSYLADIQMKESYVSEWGKVEREKKDNTVNIERAYIDYRASDTLTLRAGKYNTPAGYWNMEPINLLRDTSSNPFLSYILYPRYSTGLSLQYANPLYSNTSYSLMIQESEDLDDGYNNISVNRHYLASIEHSVNDSLHVKFNLGHFRTTTNIAYYYGLLALMYEQESYKISAEFGSRANEYRFSVPYSLYIQGVYHLKENHDIVGRYENYSIDEGARREEQLGIIGYTYRPITSITLKVEYQLRSYLNESRIRSSISIMF